LSTFFYPAIWPGSPWRCLCEPSIYDI
jgi:hypothetical protein